MTHSAWSQQGPCDLLSWVIPHPIASVFVSVLTWPPRRWAGGCSHCSQTPWRKPSLFWGQHGHFGWDSLVWAGTLQSPCLPALGSLGSHQRERGWSSLSPSPSEPLSTCAFTPSAYKGQICHRKMISSTVFFCILINTEEAGAVKLYLGENLRTGLFGVVEPLTAFNTQLVINCFVYLFSVFISTNKHCNYSY